MPLADQAGVHQLVQGGLGELGGQLAAQVVQDEQVAVEVALRLVPGLQTVGAVPEEFPGLELGEDVPRRVVDHRGSVL